ncbi:uncharacterized protein BJ171DRAFT_489522 [Polychytrium aggregatum]|uniref:uncharacterized protein n=1 Tax=Polychytrium aggregatum TaxID=110093 RepID=UPI0022FEB931|nr:uncharacterized protein BJ171DRAFT_489522 [Polychytrium aggregatum]KAI9208614.1 hypothetical protein BJ171DRAFT_489522 [Polychytrium aggregatum]
MSSLPSPIVDADLSCILDSANKPHRQLIDAPATSSVADVLGLMSEHRLSAIPIWGQAGHWLSAGTTEANTIDHEKQYIAVVSILDIVVYITSTTMSNQSLSSISIMLVVGETNEGKSLWVASPHDKIRRMLEPLSKGIHRILVGPVDGVETDSMHFQMLTQSDIIRYILQHSDMDYQLSKHLSISIYEAGLCNPVSSLVFTADMSSSVMDIFRAMVVHNLSAVPVVNPLLGGILVNTISISDLRDVLLASKVKLAKLIAMLSNMTVFEFLKLSKGPECFSRSIDQSSVTCSIDTSIADAMRLTLTGRVHRIWVVDRAYAAIGAISLSDFMRNLNAWFYELES